MPRSKQNSYTHFKAKVHGYAVFEIVINAVVVGEMTRTEQGREVELAEPISVMCCCASCNASSMSGITMSVPVSGPAASQQKT